MARLLGGICHDSCTALSAAGWACQECLLLQQQQQLLPCHDYARYMSDRLPSWGGNTYLQHADVLAVPELHLQRGHELPDLRLAHLHLRELHDSQRAVCEMLHPVQNLDSLQPGTECMHGVLSTIQRSHTARRHPQRLPPEQMQAPARVKWRYDVPESHQAARHAI